MIKQRHIDGRVQKAFDNKVKALKKQNSLGKNYFKSEPEAFLSTLELTNCKTANQLVKLYVE